MSQIDHERGLAINKRARAGSHMVECRERFKRFSSMASKDSQVVVNLVNAEIDYAIALGEELIANER